MNDCCLALTAADTPGCSPTGVVQTTSKQLQYQNISSVGTHIPRVQAMNPGQPLWQLTVRAWTQTECHELPPCLPSPPAVCDAHLCPGAVHLPAHPCVMSESLGSSCSASCAQDDIHRNQCECMASVRTSATPTTHQHKSHSTSDIT